MGKRMDNNGTNETRVYCLRIGEKRRVITRIRRKTLVGRTMVECRSGVGGRSSITVPVGCLIIRIMPTPINEPDGNTRGQCVCARARASRRPRSYARVARNTGQIAGNYFTANGRVMHLRIINSVMGRICGRCCLRNSCYLAAFSDPINSLSFLISGMINAVARVLQEHLIH